MKKFIILLVFTQLSFSQNILDLKSRADVIKDLQKDRLDNLLPDLMKETGIDMWVLITREYNDCLLYTSPSPRDGLLSRMPSSA